MLEPKNTNDRLLLGYLEHPTPSSFARWIRDERDIAEHFSPGEPEKLFSETWRLTSTDFCDAFAANRLPGGKQASEFVLFGYLSRNGARLTEQELLEIGAMLTGPELAASPVRTYLRFFQAGHIAERDDQQMALGCLDAGLGTLFDQRNQPIADCVRHMFYLRKALLYSRIGDLHVAHQSLEMAAGIAVRWGMFGVMETLLRQQQAELLWYSGQPEEALMLHLDRKCRQRAKAAGKIEWLLRSHLEACKCAIDSKHTDVAIEELKSAEEILQKQEILGAHLQGYATLYAGQIALQQLRVEEAIEKFNEALAYFQKLAPPFPDGVLEAKISLAEFALYEKNYRLFLEILRPLIVEAEERGCIEARSRLLLLQAYLFVTDDPPVKEAWNRVVERVHLINNPALLLKALSYLYQYALVQLEDRDQAFLLSRIRGLENSLEKSCFEGLYRSHVIERYERAIESRLARVLERDEGQLRDEKDPQA